MTTVAPSAALEATAAVFATGRAIQRVRRCVEDLHDLATSALRVLDEAELDANSARLAHHGDLYVEAVADHMSRLQARCTDMAEIGAELGTQLAQASRSLAEASQLVDRVAASDDPQVAEAAAYLQPRLAVLGEVVELAKPFAELVRSHVENAHRISSGINAGTLTNGPTVSTPVLGLGEAGRELDRADEDVRMVGRLIDRAEAIAHESVGVAVEISEVARKRMAEVTTQPPSLERSHGPGRPPG